MDLQRLRSETAAEHTATEDTVPLMAADLSREVYIHTLRQFLRVVRAWDAWCDEHAPADLRPVLQGRRRASLIEDDLQTLGEQPGSGVDPEILAQLAAATPGDPRSVFLGRMYVMEGSTLGGGFIAKHVQQRFGFSTGQGNSYFVGYGDSTGDRWREFRQVLSDLPETEADTVIQSARQMFAIFGTAVGSAG